jgi:multiple sugar transport system permease protein
VIVAGGMTMGVLIRCRRRRALRFARLDFPLKRALLVFCLLGLMVPEQAVFIPLYTMFADFGWHNSYHALIVPRLAVPIGVFLMMQFFRASRRDRGGGAHRRRDNLADLPPHHGAAGAPRDDHAGILTFLYAWNDYLWPLVSAQRPERFTITVGLASLQSNFAQSEGLGRVMASGVIASLPVVILFLVFQRYVVQAVTRWGEARVSAPDGPIHKGRKSMKDLSLPPPPHAADIGAGRPSPPTLRSADSSALARMPAPTPGLVGEACIIQSIINAYSEAETTA